MASLLAMPLGTDIRVGSPISLTLYWKPVAPAESRAAGGVGGADKPYTVFVHLLGPDSQIWAQQDNPPSLGTAPTSGWVPGEYVADPYQLVVKPETPAGEYRIEVGMYDPATGARLRVTDSDRQLPGDRILLGQTIQIDGR
jgi:hypothetical protein